MSKNSKTMYARPLLTLLLLATCADQAVAAESAQMLPPRVFDKMRTMSYNPTYNCPTSSSGPQVLIYNGEGAIGCTSKIGNVSGVGEMSINQMNLPDGTRGYGFFADKGTFRFFETKNIEVDNATVKNSLNVLGSTTLNGATVKNGLDINGNPGVLRIDSESLTAADIRNMKKFTAALASCMAQNGGYLYVNSQGSVACQNIVIPSPAASPIVEPIVDACEATNPPVGTICRDETKYAGRTPDGTAKLFITRCDYGMTWDGFQCVGERVKALVMPSVTSTQVTSTTYRTGAQSLEDGFSNTMILATQVNRPSGSPAGRACYDLVAHGKSDWYLPAKLELETVLANAAFLGNFSMPSTPNSRYWSSSEYTRDVNKQWLTTSTGADSAAYVKNDLNNIRCVRKR